MVTAASTTIRVSVLAPVGRVDLCLPYGVPVAEVTVELSDRLGLDPELTLCTVLGDRLAPEGTVGAQVTDGAVLQLCDATPLTELVVHDDLAEAVRGVMATADPHRDVVNQVRALGGCATAWAVGFGCGAGGYAASTAYLASRASLPPLVLRALISVLLVAGVAAIWLPRLAVSISGLSNSSGGGSNVNDAVERGHSVLFTGVVALGLVLVILVPAAMTTGPAGALLAVNVAVGHLLFSRSLPRWQMVCATVVLGSLALFFGTLVAVIFHPSWRISIAAVCIACAGALAVFGGAPGRVGARMNWLADGAQWLSGVALLPLAVWALGLFGPVERWFSW